MTAMIEERPTVAPVTAQTTAASSTRAANAVAAMPNEFLSFRLGGEEYGIDILRVQEIRSYEAPTRIANAPHFIKGVINLRGVIVPIVDLRLKLGCESAEYTDFTVVIVLNVRGRVIGVVVDSVSDVLALGADNIKPAPQMSASVDAGYIMGMGCFKSGDVERMLILTDIEALMSSAEMGLMEAAML
ncbi:MULTISPECIES: chemotaxis protein CheW [Delftia]|uniref:Chemotaxis protein CheW n=2 Tax=Delftia TaxID=80865 RepID=A0A7T2YV17_9BURK|nr:purine-binding chemotaxis protein CheW [Delftia acidovorans CCUG 15835]EPD42994.1 purine-binding chemotaxis protein CheW [Delftia acidovorans CCUG 274B]MPT54469.1 chemotaxis protein CheW [Delftia sp.]PZP65836.1 MAG: chemotaxis protein CheW [Delftia acidovorans]QPS82482.1 chemotaxis protein CheW [Delftia lacustris]SFB65495.1 purine-binding chemotaxis protein CheW [Delftia tsuruhatensis]